MKILLDENLPKKLKTILESHEVHTVSDMGWNGKKNGELLKLMTNSKFDVIITFDRNIEFQQNFRRFTVPVLVFNAPDNTFVTLSSYKEKLLELLNSSLPGGITKVI
ncbi:MAG TPA: DUF5615 family PIN-like protein [Ignavibacteria bacterium]|jgi:predicted nuclease of predicted toxin-antitoxin system|nr:DUF5615 family PIN-like protein [Ignavibacteria bacterium]